MPTHAVSDGLLLDLKLRQVGAHGAQVDRGDMPVGPTGIAASNEP
jgi:hypothetical protein